MSESSAPASILPASAPANILLAARLLRDGDVVAIPTDTLYGLAASVFNEQAVERVFTIKRRSPNERVPVLFASAADLPLLTREINHTAWSLIQTFWPGPLTLVLPARSAAPSWITRRRETVAVRVPAARSTLELLEVLGEPVVGTSANIHRHPPALNAAEVRQQLGDQVATILEDDAAVASGLPSTVAEVTDTAVQVIREGAVGLEALRAAVGPRTPVRSATAS